MTFTLVIQKTGTGYCAYAPEIPGCVVTGQSIEELRLRFPEAVKQLLLAYRERGGKLPPSDCLVEIVEIDDVA